MASTFGISLQGGERAAVELGASYSHSHPSLPRSTPNSHKPSGRPFVCFAGAIAAVTLLTDQTQDDNGSAVLTSEL